MHTQSPSKETQISSSPLLRALELVHKQALEEEMHVFIYESEQTSRGISDPSEPNPSSSEQVHVTLENQDKLSDQIAAIQNMLVKQPELERLLEKTMRAEYKHGNRFALPTAIAFTIIGAFLSYFLPLIIKWFFSA